MSQTQLQNLNLPDLLKATLDMGDLLISRHTFILLTLSRKYSNPQPYLSTP
jgi:hypothetical protein